VKFGLKEKNSNILREHRSLEGVTKLINPRGRSDVIREKQKELIDDRQGVLSKVSVSEKMTWDPNTARGLRRKQGSDLSAKLGKITQSM